MTDWFFLDTTEYHILASLHIQFMLMFYYTCNLSAFTNDTCTEMICECWIFMCIYVLNWTVRWKLKSVTFCSADSDQVIDTGLFILRDKPDEDGNVLITFTRHRDAKGVSKTLQLLFDLMYSLYIYFHDQMPPVKISSVNLIFIYKFVRCR